MDRQGVLIVGELVDGRVASITAELLTIGRALADEMNETLSTAFAGSDIGEAIASEAIALGSDKVYIMDNPLLQYYLTETYTAALASLDKEIKPAILLLGNTRLGKDLAPYLAYTLRTALTTDCVELAIDKETKRLRKTKPVYGGNARATYVCDKCEPQMATLRPKIIQPAAKDTSRKGEVIHFQPQLEATARIGGPDGFKQLQELADILGGAVGCTRIVSDNKWLPPSQQIGLTGKIASPSLYIGLALSGASQHLAGIGGNATIVAINKDPEANIFSHARYGIVDDYKKVLPALIEECKKLTSG